MAGVGRATGGWLRQVRGLFGSGTVGGLPGGQALDAFVSRRGEESLAAFDTAPFVIEPRPCSSD